MRARVKLFMLICFAFTLWGCSSSNSNAPALDASGRHPANWIVDHRASFEAFPNQCAECHGTDLGGGISKVSCFSTAGFLGFTCHPHPVTVPPWSDPVNHGAEAKGVEDDEPGFEQCRDCHGKDYRGSALSDLATAGEARQRVSCFSASLRIIINGTVTTVACHPSSPHPSPPWRASAGTATTHTDTDLRNVPLCAECHLNNQRLTVPAPVPAGTAPGCFNGTLCHAEAGHPASTPPWSDPSQHGATAKLAPSSTGGISATGFGNCQACHGEGLAGSTISRVSCSSATNDGVACHPTSPHPPAPWRISAGSARDHTDTDPQNARVCGGCHLQNQRLTTFVPVPAGTAVDCFNNSLCHAVSGHPVGWANPSQHGAAGKSDLTFCQRCHAQPGTSGPGSNPRFTVPLVSLTAGSTFSCETCHQPFTAHPPALQFPAQFGAISSAKLNRPWFTHKTAGNFQNACSLCHGASLDGAGGVGPACFNPANPATSCHITGLPFSVSPACTSCHGNPPVGSTYPNREGAHSEHNLLAGITAACGTCHNGFGTGTLAHFNDARPPRQAPADLAFVTPFPFNASGAAASFTDTASGMVCSNISCHGGIPTPPWREGSINVNSPSGCASCHQLGTAPGTPQPNSNFSGEGRHHNDFVGADCTLCHETAKLAVNHFTTLATPAMEGPASATIGGGATRVISYTPATRSCTPNNSDGACHETRTW